MTAYPLTALATLLALIVFGAFAAVVTRARGKYGVVAPATTGNPDFERRSRVHLNTLEQLILLLPILWLCAGWVGDAWAGLGGLIWSIGRVIYAVGYYQEARKRELGSYITIVPVVVMLVAVVVSIITRWV